MTPNTLTLNLTLTPPSPPHNLNLNHNHNLNPSPPPLPPRRSRSPFFNIQQPLWKYILKMGCVSLIGSILIGIILSPIADNAGVRKSLTHNNPGPVLLFLSIVFIGPIVETLFLALGLKIISLFTKKTWRLVLFSTLIWVAVHSAIVPTWGLMVAWPFMVFNLAWLAWRRRSIFHAFAAAAGIHMFHNFWPSLILLATL